MTTGDSARDAAELGELPENVHVETWVPHDDVARQADVIVCHGGSDRRWERWPTACRS